MVRHSASPLAPTDNGQLVRDWNYRLRSANSVVCGPLAPGPIDYNAYTRAQEDTRLFGEHNGISLGGPIICSPTPIAQSNVPYWFLTQKQNPWYGAPGYNPQLRRIDTKFYAGRHGMYVGKFGDNPWDRRYGHINGEQIVRNLAVVRARQMNNVSFI